MKKFYHKFRIMLMTFALGLASVFVFNGSLKFSDEIPVNLPQVKSSSVILVYPRCEFEMPFGGGSGGGIRNAFGHHSERITKCTENP